MDKKYFGSFSLQHTIRKVKEAYPECKISYKNDGEEKSVTFRFTPEERKSYGLSEGVKTYRFLNNHLILSNGNMDPFKYDRLDSLIENTELEYDVARQKSSTEKIKTALNSCQEFHDTAKIVIGNVTESGSFDVKLELNGTVRAYHVDMESKDVHLQKLDPDSEFENIQGYALSSLSPEIKYRILKTTHPGLLTVATEYISGLRSDKTDWRSPVDAYVKPWKKNVYEEMGISPFDVMADVSESRLVGRFVDYPMRHLVLSDGSEYAYGENPLEVMPYSEYKRERDNILNEYKKSIMMVCRETGVIPQKAIEIMNVYTDKMGPVVLCSPEEAITQIRMERLSDPLSGVIQKINRAIKLYNHDRGFLASLRKPREDQDIRRIDINENGSITRVDVDIMTLSVSKPYVMGVGHKRVEFEDLSHLPLTVAFIDTLATEVMKIKDRPEYKTYVFTKKLSDLKFEKEDITTDSDNEIYVSYRFPDKTQTFWVNPYDKTMGSPNLREIKENPRQLRLLEKAQEIFEEIF